MNKSLKKIKDAEKIYIKLIEQLNPPEKYIKNLNQVCKLFLPANGPNKLLEALDCCKDLFIEPDSSDSSWEEIIEYFSIKFKEKKYITELKKIWPSWNQHASYSYIFSKLVDCFLIPIPPKIFERLGLGDGNGYNLNYSMYTSCRKDALTVGKNKDDDFYEFLRKEELLDSQRKHISTISKVVYDIYGGICNYKDTDDNFSVKEQKKDCNAITETIGYIFSKPLGDLDPKEEPRTALAKYVYNFSVHNVKCRDKYEKVLNKTVFMRFIQLCIGHSSIRKNNVYGINGTLIGEVQLKTKKRNLTPEVIKNESIPFKNPFPDLYFDQTVKDSEYTLLAENYGEVEYGDITEDDELSNTDEHESASECDNQAGSEKALQESISESLTPEKTKAIRSAIDSRRYVKSSIDSNCIPNSIFIAYLEMLLKDSALKHAFCWCCVATGINWHRLENLIVSKDTSLLTDINVILNPESYHLHYNIINGATFFKDIVSAESHSYNSFVIALPKAIVSAIVNSPASKPFINIRKSLKSNERYFYNKHGGIKPTPEKLNYTFSRQISIHGLTSTEQHFISGEFNYSHRAKSKYSLIDLASINEKYSSCLSHFADYAFKGLCIKKDSNVFPFEITNNIPRGTSGTLVAQPVSSLKNLTDAFYRSKLSSITGKTQTHEERVNRIQHQQSYYYLLQQLLLVLRPVGPASSIKKIPHYNEWIISQKNSPKFKERTSFPSPKILIDQFCKCESDMNDFIEYFKLRNYIIHTPNKSYASMPLCIRINKIDREINMDVMTGNDFQNYIKYKKYAKHINHIKNHNIYRHSSYSYFMNFINEFYLSELVNHHIYDLDLFSKFSTADFKDYSKISEVIDNLAKKLNIKVI